MVRAFASLGGLLCGLCLTAPASADVVYFKPGAPIPVTMRVPSPRNPNSYGFTFIHPTSSISYTACIGRIARVVQNVTPTQIKFEPAKVTMVNVSWSERDPRLRRQPKVQWAGAANTETVNLSDLRRIDHEFDGLQDLRFAFSNRDVLLNRMTPSGPGSRLVVIGQEPFHTYFLAGGGVGIGDHMSRLTANQRRDCFVGLTRGSGLRSIPSTAVGLQEGWLVNWLNRGPLSSAARGRLYSAAFGSRRLLTRPNFVSDPGGFHPIQRETDIKTLVVSILRAAAQDYRYSRPGPGGEQETNPSGAFGMGKIGPAGSNGDSNFFLICINTIVAMCNQVDQAASSSETPQERNARDMGFKARDAVLSALEAATLGRAYAPVPAGPRLQLTTDMHVDPSDLALVALKILVKSVSWQTARFDTAEGRALDRNWASLTASNRPAVRPRPGRRLVDALLGLAREPNSPTEERASDRLRSRDPGRIVNNVPGYGPTTELKAWLVRTFEHIVIGPGGPEFLHHTRDILVNSVVQARVALDGAGNRIEDRHSVSLRQFALMVIGRGGGSGDPLLMDEVVDRLFSIALMPDGQGPASALTLRRLIRRDAIASLSHLASLGERSRRNERSPGDGVDDHLALHYGAVGNYEAISNMVFRRIENMLEHSDKGFGSHSDEEFFRELGIMANQTFPPRPLEGHAATFQAAYERRMQELLRVNRDPDRRRRVRELEKFMNAPAGQ